MNKASNSGLGLGTILFLIFMVLKLCNVIDWSWLYVCMPLIISAGLWLLTFIISLIIYLID